MRINIQKKIFVITAISFFVILACNNSVEAPDYSKIDVNSIGIELRSNSYYIVDYSGIYYINKGTNTVDSIRGYSFDSEKNILGLWYVIPNKSSFGCSTSELNLRKVNYHKIEESE